MTLAFFLTHFWQYNYAPAHEVYYHGAAWPNVAVIPLAAICLGIYHYVVTKPLHREHMAALAHDKKLAEEVLKHLDPEAATDGMLDRIADRVDETTPGGVGALAERIDRVGKSVAELHSKSDVIDTRLAVKPRKPAARKTSTAAGKIPRKK